MQIASSPNTMLAAPDDVPSSPDLSKTICVSAELATPMAR